MRQTEAGRIPHQPIDAIPIYDRRFFEGSQLLSRIGGGTIGGKASGLAFAHRIMAELFPGGLLDGVEVAIPRFVVLGTDVFDAFLKRNNLPGGLDDDSPNDRVAQAFQRADFPIEFAGDLRAITSTVHLPLAVRSSSCLEDSLYEPLAGVYATKMIPNNQSDGDTRYVKLIEAIKFVFSSVFFREARGYLNMIGRTPADEKMAVIIQEVVGRKHGDRFYPTIAGVGRSYNFYPVGQALPDEGVVDLALGLGKTIVDGGKAWTYSPAHPQIGPPVTIREQLRNTQTEFWAVNMGKPPAYDPLSEAEFLVRCPLADAEADGTLGMVASTYVAADDRIVIGIGRDGARVLDFAPLLRLEPIPLNDIVDRILRKCHDELGVAVEIEFAATIEKDHHRFCLLQVRPMLVSQEEVGIEDDEMSGPVVLLASEATLGNGSTAGLQDIVYVRPDTFSKEHTQTIAAEIDQINRLARQLDRTYVLIGFGRWGSSDPWLGIPVDWGSISGARVLVEATLPDMNVELSQGSHFFHNITSLQIPYFCVPFTGPLTIDWEWLAAQEAVVETPFVRYVRINQPLTVRLDGRRRRGVILK